MSKLKAVPPKAAEPSRPKILIYGKPGVGKTWASLDFPSAYYIDTEGGADLAHYTDKLAAAKGAYFGIDQGSLDFDSVIEQIKALATEEHPYKTVIIDSITKIFNNEISKEAERLGDKNAFGADKKPALLLMKRLVSWLQRLDMNVILIAHEKSAWGMDSKGQRAEIGTTFDCYDKLEYELHLCLNIVKIGGKHLAKVKKSRLKEFADASTLPWSYSDFADCYGRDILERNTGAITLPTEAQLKELTTLIEAANIPQAAIDKWLTAGNATEFKDLDADKVDKYILAIKDKLTKTIKGE